ncbi:MAG: hypothetical protein KBB11_05190 [Bacteroidales bacterium]|nr:hypothetical protein [Bacteroidales bacterium]
MKTVFFKRAFLIMLGSALGSMTLNAQEDSNFGSNPDECKVKLSTYTEFFKQENYHDAYPAWTWCIKNCPASTKNLYIHGPTILDYLISNAKDQNTKESYIDTLMMVYDMRIKYYNEEGKVLGRKANDLLKYRPDSIKQAYNIYKRSIELTGNSSESSVLGYFMNVSVILLKSGDLSKETVVENYSTVSEILDKQIAAAAGDDKTVERLSKINEKVEEMFVNTPAADCEAIITIFTPKYEANKTDLVLLQKIAKLIEKTKNQDCLTTDLYASVSESLYVLEKDAESAHKIAKVYFIKNNTEKAEFYYNEAIRLQSDEKQKADLYYELATLYFGNLKMFAKSRDFARKALASDPNYGKAYLLIGKCYASGGSGCGETELDKVAVYWVVVDQFHKAKSADPSVSEEANELIRKYSGYFPTQEKAFWYNVSEGQPYTVGCWINESTTARFIQ